MPDRERPHVVLLMADQLRRDCISCYGDLAADTPNLDALSEESVVFDRVYCSTPLCVPTRVSMYTGKWPHTTGVVVNKGGVKSEHPHGELAPGHRTLYEALDGAGYGVTHVGVHHCHARPTVAERVPGAYIEDREEWRKHAAAVGVPASMYAFPHVKRNSVRTPQYAAGRPVVGMIPTPRAHMPYPRPAEDFMDVFWARRAEERISRLDPSRPQLVEVLFWAPHPPHVVPEPYYSMYPPDTIAIEETVGVWCPGQPATLLNQTCGHVGATCRRDEYPPAWSAYFGLVTLVDECLGRVIRALKERGIWDDALVIFTQDHGEMLGCHGLWEKHCCYEEAAHVPLFVKPPGGATGRRRQLAGHVDLADTVCAYTRAARLPGSQGASLRPVVEDADHPWRSETFIEFNGDHGRGTQARAVVADLGGRTLKYIATPGDVDELYDLDRDPKEKESLVAPGAENAEHRDIRDDLRSRLVTWMRESGDYIELPPA